MSVVQVSLQASPVYSLPLTKRNAVRESISREVKELEPNAVTLCERGWDMVQTFAIKSAHIKRHSNTPHVAVTMTNPMTGKRASTALWKVLTVTTERGTTVVYRDGSIFNLSLENLRVIAPTPKAEESEQDEAEESQAENFRSVVDPVVVELQIMLVNQSGAEFQNYLQRTANNVLRKHISRNVWELAEDLVSQELPGLWSQITRGIVRAVTYEGLRGWAAESIAASAERIGKFGANAKWGYSIGERPRHMARNEVQICEYAEFTDAASARLRGELPARVKKAGTSDEQWAQKFGKVVGSLVGVARKDAGLTLNVRRDPRGETLRKQKQKQPMKKKVSEEHFNHGA